MTLRIRSARVHLGYLVAGGLVAVLWMSHSGESPWIHGLRLLVIMAVVMSVSTLVRRFAARRGRRIAHHPVGRFLLAKVALLVLGVVAAVSLERWLPTADVWVALGMGVVTALVGPLIHPWLNRSPSAVTAVPVAV